jgi:ribosomal protein L7/L12
MPISLTANIPYDTADVIGHSAVQELISRHQYEYDRLLKEYEYQPLADFIVRCSQMSTKKLASIKLFRALTGLDLKQSKDAIERAEYSVTPPFPSDDLLYPDDLPF